MPAYPSGQQAINDNKQSVLETTRETSFEFSAFHAYYNTLFKDFMCAQRQSFYNNKKKFQSNCELMS